MTTLQSAKLQASTPRNPQKSGSASLLDMRSDAADREPTVREAQERARQWIIDYLERTGWPQVQLAEKLGVSEATITNVVKGTFLPGFKMILRLHFRLGAPLNEVLRHTRRAPRDTMVAKG